MVVALVTVVLGLVLLVWSADRFIDGSAAVARHFKIAPFVIGMVIVGFGTSTPELIVSAQASLEGAAGIALGNIYGSNIVNIALILGLTALIRPVVVRSRVVRQEMPFLVAVTGLAAWQLWDGVVTRADAAVLLGVFVIFMVWMFRCSGQAGPNVPANACEAGQAAPARPLAHSLGWVAAGLVALIISSRMLVWGSVKIAQMLGVSDLVIGLTIVAAGTSLPELASSIVAARKGEDDIALGNIIGSNIYNILAVGGVAAALRPLSADPSILARDMVVLGILTLGLWAFGWGFHRQGRINRLEGGVLVASYILYVAYLVMTA